MKRYLRLFAIYVAIALAVVVLYAPWGLALRPWDYSILRAGASIICGIALAGTFVTSTWFALKDPDVKLLDAAEVDSDEEVLAILAEYADSEYVSQISREATDQVRRASYLEDRLMRQISRQFSEHSLSWERFCELAKRAHTQVLRNAALVANDIQSFDRAGYARERAKARSGAESATLALLDSTLAEMREVLDANEQLLLEMARLEHEVKRLDVGDAREDAESCMDDLRQLIQDTKYYG